MAHDAESFGRSFVNFQFDSVARYTILDHLGTGGMGIVFLSQRETSGVHESVVLKTIRQLTPSTLEELRQEANLATRLRHPNIVRTYGLETVKFEDLSTGLQGALAALQEGGQVEPSDDMTSTNVGRRPAGLRRRRAGRRRGGRASQPEIRFREPKRKVAEEKPKGHDLSFIVMDYIDGIDLLELHVEHLRRGALLPVMLGAYIIARVARSLEYAHNFLIHRDVSPGNVLIDSLGMPLLSDFGIAVASGDANAVRAGKLSYIAPEVLGGAPFDERVDLYSLGMMAYLLASGVLLQRVQKSGTMEARLANILAQVDAGFPPLEEIAPDVPPEYSAIVSRLIDPDPERRPPRAGSVASEIEQKVLYAHGFGPTNNSLAAYIDIFEKKFENYDFDQLNQLGFLKDSEGQWTLERQLGWSLYSEAGRALIESRPESSLAMRLRQLESERAEAGASASVERLRGRWILKVRFGDNCMESIPIEQELTIGRSAQMAQVVLVDKAASRCHARLLRETDGMVVEDLDSGNGTYVGDEPITRVQLEDGGQFRIGKTVLYCVKEPPDVRPLEPTPIDALGVAEALVDKGRFTVQLEGRQRHLLSEIWGELARQCGLGDRASYLLNQALLEACALAATDGGQLQIQVLRERAALRFLFWSDPGSDRLLRTLLLFKRLLGHRAAEVEISADQMAVTIVRQVFDRIDFYLSDHLLLLSKSF